MMCRLKFQTSICKNILPRCGTGRPPAGGLASRWWRSSGRANRARPRWRAQVFADKPYVSLEDPDERALADADPRRFLARFAQGAILDEAQHCPALFSYLQRVVDEHRRTGEFMLTGSRQFGLMSRITQSLAGRVGLLQLLPLSLAELQCRRPAPAHARGHALARQLPAVRTTTRCCRATGCPTT